MYLIIGNDKNSAALTCLCEEEESLVNLGRDSLLTAKWNDDFFNHLPGKVPEHLAKNLKLSEEFTRLPLTGLSLRLPISARWDEKLHAVVLDGLDITVRATPGPGISLEKNLESAAAFWGAANKKLLSEKDIDVGKAKGKLFEGTSKSPFGTSHVLFALVVGNGKNSAVITIIAPNSEAIVQLLRQSLKTVKWESEDGEDSVSLLHRGC
jgi:hypothetical protein